MYLSGPDLEILKGKFVNIHYIQICSLNGFSIPPNIILISSTYFLWETKFCFFDSDFMKVHKQNILCLLYKAKEMESV